MKYPGNLKRETSKQKQSSFFLLSNLNWYERTYIFQLGDPSPFPEPFYLFKIEKRKKTMALGRDV
jgi:hypothetical protein